MVVYIRRDPARRPLSIRLSTKKNNRRRWRCRNQARNKLAVYKHTIVNFDTCGLRTYYDYQVGVTITGGLM